MSANTLKREESERPDAARAATSDGPPSGVVSLFASLFTPTWSLGLLLFACFFLPFVRSCEGQPPDYPYEALTSGVAFTPQEIWSTSVLVFPFFLGLLVACGTLLLAATRQPGWARPLWWCYASLLILNALLIGWLAVDDYRSAEVELFDWPHAVCAAAVLLVPLTAWLCKTPYNAAMWLQTFLCLAAAAIVSLLAAAGELLIGGKLAVTASVFLILSSVVQRLDGHRCLTRRREQSGLQLSLRSMLILMALGGLASAWVGGYLFSKQIAAAANVKAAASDKSSGGETD